MRTLSLTGLGGVPSLMPASFRTSALETPSQWSFLVYESAAPGRAMYVPSVRMTQSIFSFWTLALSVVTPYANSSFLLLGSLKTASMSAVISTRRSDLKRCSVSFCLFLLSLAHLPRLVSIFFRMASVV